MCSPALFVTLENTADNARIDMAVSHIDRLTLRNFLQQHTEYFLPICINDTSTSYVPPNLRGNTIYHFPYDKLPQNATVQQVLDHPEFMLLRQLVATLTGQQELPTPNVGPIGKSNIIQGITNQLHN